jgi:type II secretory pathway component PulM
MIKEKWEQLSERDQKTLKMGGIILAVLCFLQFIWWPLFNRISTLQAAIDKEATLYEWMHPRVAQLMQVRDQGLSPVEAKSLPGVEKTLQEMGMKPFVTQFSQNPQSLITITFSEVPFESSIEWLEKVQRQGWVVQSMHASKGKASGMVELEFVLK